jgi:hypothetical protein
MRTGSGLFDLIRSMSASEKRYFNVFASRHTQKGKNHYMEIFELINAQSEYDEQAILSSLPDEKTRRQFPVMKNYLYKLILKSLRNFHAGQSIDFQLKELLMDTEVLLRRDLVRPSMKQLEKARALALKHEKYEYLLEVGARQLTLATKLKENNLERLGQTLEDIFQDTRLWLDRYQKIEAFRKLSLQMLLLNRREQHITSPEVRAEYEKIIHDPLMLTFDPDFPQRAHSFYYQCHFIYHFASGEPQKAFENAAKVVKILEDNPYLIEERPENYLHSMQNLAVVSPLCRSVEESLALIKRMTGFEERFPRIKFDERLQRSVLFFGYNLEMQLLVESRQMEAAAAVVPRLHTLMEHHDFEYNVNEGYALVAAWFTMAQVYLYEGEFNQALSFVNRILNQEGMNEDYEVYLYTRILRVMILFDAGDYESLEYALLSLHRYLNKRKQKFRFENTLLRFLKRSFDLAPGKDILPHFRRLRAELTQLIDDPGEPHRLQDFGIIYWLERHLAKGQPPS